MLTKEQRAQRRKHLGASDIGVLWGFNAYKSPLQLWAEKTGRMPDKEDDGNKASILGSVIEPYLLDSAERDYGPLDRDYLAPHARYPEVPIVSRCDAVIREGRNPVEAKTAGIINRFLDVSDWGDDNSGEIPLAYSVQVQTQIACVDATHGYVVALIGGRGRVPFRIERSQEAIELIETKAVEWWQRHVVDGEMPDPQSMDARPILEIVRDEKSVVELPDTIEGLVAERERIKQIEKKAKDAKELVNAKLAATLGDAKKGETPSGFKVYVNTINRRGYSVADTSYNELNVRKPKGWEPPAIPSVSDVLASIGRDVEKATRPKETKDQ